jgi:hypothetical protein
MDCTDTVDLHTFFLLLADSAIIDDVFHTLAARVSSSIIICMHIL